MWVDRRANWHIINRAIQMNIHIAANPQCLHICLVKTMEKRFMLQNPNIELYSHTVSYEDGTTHTYTTLERPNCHFNKKGK